MVSAGLVIAIVWAIIVVQRIAELVLAKRNERWALEQGACEYGAGHYPLFFVLHTGWLLAWPLEAWGRGPVFGSAGVVWLVAFALAQGLRYWAVATLGRRWNTRILVIDGLPPIDRGPYRYVAHPNYLAVVIELAAIPLAFGAWITAAVVGLLNLGLLLRIRIPAEEAALRSGVAR